MQQDNALKRSLNTLVVGAGVLPEVAFALGDPAIIYWFAGALILHVACFAAIVIRKTLWKLATVLIFLALSVALWTVIWFDNSLSVGVAGLILTCFPLMYVALTIWLTLKFRVSRSADVYGRKQEE